VNEEEEEKLLDYVLTTLQADTLTHDDELVLAERLIRCIAINVGNTMVESLGLLELARGTMSHIHFHCVDEEEAEEDDDEPGEFDLNGDK
jgi:hypothetical protein